MQIWREYRSQRINEIVNHPSVLPKVSADGQPMDVSGILADLRNVLLMGEHGGVIFICLGDGVYEAHTQVLPEGRGRWAFEFVQSCVDWMFLHTPCIDLFSRVPDGNRPARTLAIAVGGVLEMRRENGWVSDNKPIGCEVYTIRMADWVKKAKGLSERGEEIHREFEELGVAVDHGHHDQHNRYVGLAALLVEGGQPLKAQWWYNCWAVKAGFVPLIIRQVSPLIFAMGTVEIEYDGARMRVVSCQ